jgi:hypothetical protein
LYEVPAAELPESPVESDVAQRLASLSRMQRADQLLRTEVGM